MKKINNFSGEYFFLSNFYSAPVKYEGTIYRNNEAAFQAQKCINPANKQKFIDLIPSEAKRLGRRIELRRDWENVKVSIMKNIVKAKFEQNSKLAEKLIATKDTHLEEGNSWGDRVWGTVNGIGTNKLGKILMEVRNEIIELKKIA